MELIDTHTHLTYPELGNDIESVLQRSIAAGVTGWITIGTDPAQVKNALDLASRFENMWAGAAFHPHHAEEISEGALEELKKFAENDKVVAIGETGLDYHYNFSTQARQKDVFRAQLKIAEELNLPVIVHTRNAFDDSMQILDEFSGRLKNVVIHCYSGTIEQTKLVLDRGYYVSFTGVVTFKKCDDVRAAAQQVPLDRLMIETDCPYISPEPVRSQRPCEPAMLVHTAKKLAQVHGISPEAFAAAVTATSKHFFNLA